MSNFGTMISRIADEIARTDLTTTQIPRCIKTAIQEAEIERFWFTEGRAFAVTDATQGQPAYYDAPTDLIELDNLIISVNGSTYELDHQDWVYIDGIDTQGTTGLPKMFAYYNDDFRLYPTPDASYTMFISYHKRLVDLSLSADTNAWMTYGEAYIRNKAKRILYTDVIRTVPQLAATAAAAEQAAHQALRAESGRRVTKGVVSARRYF